MESVDPKINMSLWFCYMKKMTKQKKEQGAEGRQTSEPEKAHSTGDFVIVAKFGDHVLCCLASSLSNVIKQVGRQADENSSLDNFLRIQYLHLVTIQLF